MAIDHARSGELIDLRLGGIKSPNGSSATLVRADHVEVFRMVMPRGKRTPEHQAAGAITIQCLEGAIELSAHGDIQRLEEGQLVYLQDAQPHAVHALEDTTLLISLWLHRR